MPQWTHVEHLSYSCRENVEPVMLVFVTCFKSQGIWPEPTQVVLVVKNLPANARDVRDMSSIPRTGRSPRGGHGNLLQYSCLGNPWTEDPGRLQSMGSQLKQLSMQGEWSCDWQGLPQVHLSLNEITEAQTISDLGPGLDNSQRIWGFAHGL